MKGLLLKDLYVAKEYCRSYLLMVLVFLGVSCFSPDNMFFLFYPNIFCGLIVETLFAFDEKCGFLRYRGALPCTKKDYVNAKYIFGIAAQFTVYLLTCICYGISLRGSGKFEPGSYCNVISLVFSVSCLAVSLSHPFIFRYGVEKGRIAYYVLIGFGCAAGLIANYALSSLQFTGTFQMLVPPFLFLLGILCYLISWKLSLRFFQKREGA